MNFYKPRFKVVKRTNRKNLLYKNSRLWKFNDKRGFKFLRKGFWHRQYLKLKNLNWIIRRRSLRVNKTLKDKKNLNFKNYLDNRKSFLQFYGKFKFGDFKRFFFMYYKKKRLNKLNFFLRSFEFRPSTVLFRLKFFPTIFASNYFIRSQGFLLNGNLNKNINQIVKIGDIISIDNNYWFLFLYMFEKKIYKRLTRFTSFFLRKKKFFNKFKLFYYINNKQFMKKKKMKFITKFQHDSFSQKFSNYNKLHLNVKNNRQYFQLNKNLNFRTNYLKYLNRLNTEKNSKVLNYKKKENKKSLNNIYSFFRSNQSKSRKNFKLTKYNKFSKINLNFKYNDIINSKYKNIKLNLIKIKLLSRLKKIKSMLDYFYKFIKIIKNKNLNFLWLFLYLKYKQLKFSLINKKTNIDFKLKKITFVNLIKKHFFNKFDTKVSYTKIDNNNKSILSFFKLFKQFNLINLNNSLKVNKKSKLSIFLNVLFNSQILNNKSNNIKHLKDYENRLFNYNKLNKNSIDNSISNLNYSNDLKEVLNIKIQLFSILFFSKVLTYNIKLVLNNNYLKVLLKLIKNSSLKNYNNFILKENNIEKNKNFEVLYLFFVYKLILLNNKNNLNNFMKFIEKNKKIEFVLKDLFMNYFWMKYSSDYVVNNRFFIWYKLNKKNISKNKKQKNLFSKITKLKKILLKKTKWRFFKKFNYGIKLNEFWYLPKYYDFNFYTLKGGILRNPLQDEIYTSSKISFKNLINNYKQYF